MPRKRQTKNTFSIQSRVGKISTLTEEVIKKVGTELAKGRGQEQAWLLCGISTRTGYHWMREARVAQLEIERAENETEAEKIIQNKRLHLQFLQVVEENKAKGCVARDDKIARIGQKRQDWRAFAHLNKVHNPDYYSDDAVVNRAVAKRLDNILNNLFFLVSPDSYQEVKDAIAEITDQKLDLMQMDELKALQVLMESQWIAHEDAGVIATKYLEMRKSVQNFLTGND